jgi:hypothetical protein
VEAQIAVRLSAIRTGSALLPRNIIFSNQYMQKPPYATNVGARFIVRIFTRILPSSALNNNILNYIIEHT